MLKEILAEIGGGADLASLSRKLGIAPEVLEGMIQTLVQSGYLAESTTATDSCPTGHACDGCGVKRLCTPAVSQSRIFTLTKKLSKS